MILVVGERFNRAHMARDWEPEEWLPVSLKLGAWLRGQGREKLKLLLGDAEWASCNLTPPDDQDAPFDERFAARVAELIAADSQWERIVLCGRRVATAFGRRGPGYQWGRLIERRFIVVPHPSGLNRFWNDPAEVTRVGERTRWALTRAAAGEETSSSASSPSSRPEAHNDWSA